MINQQEEEKSTDVTAFKYEIERLRSGLENLEKPTTTSIIKDSSMFSFSHGLNASYKPFEKLIDYILRSL